MSIRIPIISEFDGKGIDRAAKEFADLETTGQKAGFALKKAFVPAVATIGALGAAFGVATKAAIEDAAAQTMLATTLRNVTAATDQQIATVENQISALSKASGVADDQLRPAFEALTRGTKDISESTKQMTLVMDIARGTNRDLTEVADALAKAYEGNFKGLRTLTPEMATLIKEGASLDQILAVLGGTFGGLSAQFADTAQGSLARLNVAFNEAKESIGAALLPIIEQLLPRLINLASWIEQNTSLVTKIAGAVSSFAGIILIANTAIRTYETGMKLAAAANTAFGASTTAAAGKFGLVIAAIAATIAILNRLKQNSDATSRGIVTAFDFVGVSLLNAAVILARGLAQTLNPAIDAINALNPFQNIPRLPMPEYYSLPNRTSNEFSNTPGTPKLQFPTPQGPPAPNFGIPAAAISAATGAGGRGGRAAAPAFAAPALPAGIDFGAALYNLDLAQSAQPSTEITINVTGGLATSAEIGQAVVDSIRSYNTVNGPAPIAVA